MGEGEGGVSGLALMKAKESCECWSGMSVNGEHAFRRGALRQRMFSRSEFLALLINTESLAEPCLSAFRGRFYVSHGRNWFRTSMVFRINASNAPEIVDDYENSGVLD